MVHLLGHGGHLAGGCCLGIQDLEKVVARDVLHQGERNEQRFILYLGLPEGGHSLFEGSDDGATKLVKLNGVTHGRVEAKSDLGSMVSDEANLEVGQEVFRVEIPTRSNSQAPDFLKVLGNADEACVEQLTAELEINWHVVGTGARADCGQGVAHGYEVVRCQFIFEHRRGSAAIKCGVSEVGTDPLDLRDHVDLTGGDNCDHQHDRGTTDNNAERGERSL